MYYLRFISNEQIVLGDLQFLIAEHQLKQLKNFWIFATMLCTFIKDTISFHDETKSLNAIKDAILIIADPVVLCIRIPHQETGLEAFNEVADQKKVITGTADLVKPNNWCQIKKHF